MLCITLKTNRVSERELSIDCIDNILNECLVSTGFMFMSETRCKGMIVKLVKLDNFALNFSFTLFRDSLDRQRVKVVVSLGMAELFTVVS